VDNLKHWSVAIPSDDQIWISTLLHDLSQFVMLDHINRALELAYKKGYQAGQDSQKNNPQFLCESDDKGLSDS
jgi:hypothetical protein